MAGARVATLLGGRKKRRRRKKRKTRKKKGRGQIFSSKKRAKRAIKITGTDEENKSAKPIEVIKDKAGRFSQNKGAWEDIPSNKRQPSDTPAGDSYGTKQVWKHDRLGDIEGLDLLRFDSSGGYKKKRRRTKRKHKSKRGGRRRKTKKRRRQRRR